MAIQATQVVLSFHDLNVSGEHNNVTVSNIIQITASEIKTRGFVAKSPYLGFQHFDEQDSASFFGRDQTVAALLRAVTKRDLVVVAGGSGSGKSSVVRAGLIPELQARLPRDLFRRFVWTPDSKPFRGFYSSLIAGGITHQQAEMADPHEPNSRTLTETVAKLAGAGMQWLLFIDRFEELFTMCDENQREVFVDSLVHLIKHPPHQVGLKVVIALRSDYLDHLGQFPELARLVRVNLSMVTSLHPDELRQIIERPAANHGVVYEEGLVEEILRDIKGQPGALPLLQFTLDKLWEAEDLSDRTVNLKTYHELGGIRGALAKRADAFFDELSEADKSDARYVFLRLIDVKWQDQTMRAVPRRVPRDQFSTRLTPLIERLTLAEFLTGRQERMAVITNGSTSTMLDGRATLEIAHEVMLDAWPKLQGWIRERQKALFMHGRVAERTTAWLEARQHDALNADDELLTGRELTKASDMRARGDFFITVEGKVEDGLTEPENRFLDSSLERRAERRTSRYINLFTRLTAVGLALALALMLLDVRLRFGLLRVLCRP